MPQLGLKARSGALWACSLIASVPTAHAADPNRNEPAAADVVPQIVVTAQKREEDLQNVPLSIAAFGTETLNEMGVQDFSALAARIPGVALNSVGPGRSSYSIRG